VALLAVSKRVSSTLAGFCEFLRSVLKNGLHSWDSNPIDSLLLLMSLVGDDEEEEEEEWLEE
jgi:hypothetical protein